MAELLQEYELSVWEDISSTDAGLGSFIEKKIAVIGSHNLHTPTKAYNVSLKENVNGEKTLTFSLPRAYRDKDGELKDNPFLSLLTAERKLKLRDGPEYDYYKEDGSFDPSMMTSEDDEERWTDYIIKIVDEDKESFVNNYTCKEAYVNELGKNGWSVVLDSELENNYGTLSELATKVLDGSDWTIDENSYNPAERVNEPLFVAIVPILTNNDDKVEINAISLPSGEGPVVLTNTGLTYVYTFYSQVELNDNGEWRIKADLTEAQIMWNNGKLFSDAQLDDNRTVIDNYDQYNYLIRNGLNGASPLAYVRDNCIFLPTGGTGNIQTSAMQGGRVVQAIRSHYEPVAGKYVEDWIKKDNTPVYHYIETKMITSQMVGNIVANANGYTTLLGWTDANEGALSNTVAELKTYYEGSDPYNYLRMPKGGTIFNQGLSVNKLSVKSGQKFVFRARIRALNTSGTPVKTAGQKVTVGLAYLADSPTWMSNYETFTLAGDSKFTIGNDGYPVAEDRRVDNKWYVDEQGYYCLVLTVGSESLVKQSYGHTVTLAVKTEGTANALAHFQDIQLFEYIEDNSGLPIYPTDIPTAEAIEIHHFYTIGLQNGESVVNELAADPALYTPVYTTGCQAVRHIDVKESNYFNNINALAELFGVWVKFKTLHQKNGALKLESDTPVKTVKFTRFSSEDDEMNWGGFRYGINLKSIKRNVESNAIASKVIVKNNSNEFAVDGAGSIRRAENNPTGDNIIYNFDYYVAHGLLDSATIVNDLYGTTSSHFAYYSKLKELNNRILPMNNRLAAYKSAYRNAADMLEYANDELQGAQQQYDILAARYEAYLAAGQKSDDPNVVATKEAKDRIQASIVQFRKDKQQYEKEQLKYESLIYGNEWNANTKYALNDVVKVFENNEAQWYYSTIKDNIKNNPSSSQYWTKFADGFNDWETEYFENLPVSAQVDFLAREKKRIDLLFYKKYHRFIQEATWTDEKYMDDNLYYYDAIKVSAQNAWPKTKYTIGVVDVSGVEKLAAYKFKVGQKSHVEDTEFFGYEWIKLDGFDNPIKTPKKKEVIISERTRNFDDPNKSSITIQTYKNQFEELFSKLTATTQSLQYASGEYQRAANVVESDGSIAIESLEQAFAKNSFILANATNQLVSWDSGRGIEAADAKNPTQVVRVTSAGIMLTNDGGRTWSTGITASGINTSLLTTGTISADKIRIVSNDGTSAAFAWDYHGINAYQGTHEDENGSIQNHFVRFDQYGIYGTDRGLTLDNALQDKSGDDAMRVIRDYSNFSLTWEGLLLNYQSGATSVSSMGGLEIFHGENGETWKFPDEYISKYKPWKPDGTTQYTSDDSIPVVSVGRYYTSPTESGLSTDAPTPHYGLRMRNKAGQITLDTSGENGNLWLLDSLSIGRVDNSATAGIDGNISKAAFWAGSSLTNNEYSFSVQHDGTLNAQQAKIKGDIEADTISVKQGTISGNILIGTTNPPLSIPELSPLYLPTEGEEYEQVTGDYSYANAGICTSIAKVEMTEVAIGENETEWQKTVTNEEYAYWAGPVLSSVEPVLDSETGNIITEGYSTIVPRFCVDNSGKLIATEADIRGHIVAESGEFTGTVYATSGSFTGQISATSGSLRRVELGDESNISYIGLPSDMTVTDDLTLMSVNNDNFIVTAGGDLFANKLFLSYRGEGDRNNGDNYYIAIGDNNIFSVKNAEKNTIFNIDKDSNIYMSGALNGEGLNICGDIVLSGAFSAKDINGNTTLHFSGENGGSIWGGNSGNNLNGWTISGDGSAEFNNVKVRGAISSVIFESQRTSAIGGSLIISPTFYIDDSMELDENGKIEPEESEEIPGKYTYIFNITDLSVIDVWAKITRIKVLGPTDDETWVPENFIEVTCSAREFTVEGSDTKQYKLAITTDKLDPNPFVFGAQVISVDENINSISLTASEASGPRIIMKHTLNESVAPAAEDEETELNQKTYTVVIGSLSNINSQYFDNIDGHGFYADNAYITGYIFLPNAGLTNENVEFDYTQWANAKRDNENQVTEYNSPIRFWAGASQEDRTTAPLVITQDGSLYAEKGVFKGQIIAKNSNFSGTISAAGIVLSHEVDSNIEDEHQSFKIQWKDEADSKPADSTDRCDPLCNFQIAEFNYNGTNLTRGLQFWLNDTIPEVNDTEKIVPMLKVITENRPRLISTEFQAWDCINKSGHSASLLGNELAFTYAKNLTYTDYDNSAQAVIDDVKLLAIAADETQAAIAANTSLHLKAGGNDNLQVHIDRVQINTNLRYGDSMEVKTVADGLIFNYIGDD